MRKNTLHHIFISTMTNISFFGAISWALHLKVSDEPFAFNVGILFQYSDEGSTFLFMSCDVCLFLSYIFETFFQNSSTFRWILSTIYDTLTKTTTQNNVHRTLNFFSWTENGKKNSNCRTFFLRNIVFHFSTQFEKNLPIPIQMRIFNKFLDNFMTFRI